MVVRFAVPLAMSEFQLLYILDDTFIFRLLSLIIFVGMW